MPDPDVAAAFVRHEPWITKCELHGASSGGWFDATNDHRIEQFRRCFPDAKRILEFGALEGGHTIGLARLPGGNTFSESKGAHKTWRARLAQELYEVSKIEFIEPNLEQNRLSEFGPFDVIYCSGLLYHLPEPWKRVEQFAAVAPGLFLWTHCTGEVDADYLIEGYRGCRYAEGGPEEVLSGLSPDSFWPTLGSLCTMLTTHGFAEVRLLENNAAHPHGPAVTMAAVA
ncbi:MAG: class I SAM-dependent methyltransferase [Chthoniobacterales bacterium]